ncbi:hypothetical protein [Amycolatopsis sp. NPDC051071]
MKIAVGQRLGGEVAGSLLCVHSPESGHQRPGGVNRKKVSPRP